MLENLPKGRAEAFQFDARQPSGSLPGPDAGPEQAFVGINVTHSGEKFLVEQCRLYGHPAASEQGSEFGSADGQGLGAGPGETRITAQIAKLETPEAAGIDKTQFAAAGKRQAGMGVRSQGNIPVRDQQSSRHA